ncbi:SGNH hydrolase domain-containing protein [Candidatus Accumulibacter meliphilus]|uniref:SGNH hydrolase domain-containing protein n=1 Tax=Candidatus Accumulibacter meliphilus TaxID=2211374 RepID=UPI003DA931DC
MEACSQPERPPVADLPLEECTYGPDKQHPKLLLWGDSHAHHLWPMLTEAFPDVAVYELTMPRCVPLVGPESEKLTRRPSPAMSSISASSGNSGIAGNRA